METLTQQISKHSSATLLPEPHSDNKGGDIQKGYCESTVMSTVNGAAFEVRALPFQLTITAHWPSD